MAKTVSHQDLKSYFGDEDHLEKSQSTSFTGMIFELLSERKPSEAELKIFELILNLSIDHGPDTPSAVPTIEAAKGGKTISEAVAAGLLEINDRHGGAIEPAMNFFKKIKDENLDPKDLVKEYLDEHKLIGGFGHRIYKDQDPRAQLILDRLSEAQIGQEWAEIALKVEQAIEQTKGAHLPLNIDGAIAVALLGFGWEPKLAKAVFIVARVPGLCAHYLNNNP